MRFLIQDTLSSDDVERGLRAVFRDGLASQAMATLTGGVFLVAFALELGASNALIGLLAAVPPLAQLLQIPSVALVNRVQNRRALSVGGSVLGRSFWVLVALVPLVTADTTSLLLLVLFLLAASGLGAVSNCAWNSWMRDLVPADRLGRFFSHRMMWATGLGIMLSLGGAFFVDSWSRWFPNIAIAGYSVLFLLGTAAGLLGAYFISTIPEPRMTPQPIRLSRLFRRPLQDRNFRNLLVFLGSWSFAANLAAPFFTVYMLDRLQLSLSLVIGLTVLSQAVHLGCLRVWGPLSDRYSNTAVLSICSPSYLTLCSGRTKTTKTTQRPSA